MPLHAIESSFATSCSSWRGAAFILLGAVLTAGCAEIVPHHDQPLGAMEGPPRGLYVMTAHVQGTGPFCGSTRVIIAATPTGNGFRANSRPGAASDLIGGFDGFLAGLLGIKGCPSGAFLHWKSPTPFQSGSVRGTLTSPKGDFYTIVCALDQPIELRSLSDDRLIGLLTIEPATSNAAARSDFAQVVDQVEPILTEHLFDPSLCSSPGTQAYLRQLRMVGGIARDDLEFLMGTVFASRRLGFSHMGFSRELAPRFKDRLSELSAVSPLLPREATAVTVEDGIATLRIAHFGGLKEETDAAFDQIASLDPDALIIDLRDTPGGTHVASRVAAHLVTKSLGMGVFFTGKARAQVLAGHLNAFPEVSPTAMDKLDSLLAEHGAIVGVLDPVVPFYKGPVAMLVNCQTASAAEPLAAGLQEVGRATIVGETTAGAMLSSQSFDLGQGWKLSVPTADYLTPKGTRLEGRGVLPDIRARSDDAPRAAREFLRRQAESH